MKIKIIIAIFLIGIVSAKAQEFSVKANGGLSGLQYDSALGDGSIKFGGGLGLGYTYFLNDHWGILTGIEANYNSNEFELYDNQIISSYEVDDQRSAFEYKVAPKGYKETQCFFSFAIPVMLQYRTEISNATSIYIGLGVKFLIPSKLNTTASASGLELSGYYPDINLEVTNLPSHGFGNVSNWQKETTTTLKTSILGSIEGGFAFKLKKGMQLYTGIYADYSLTDLQGQKESKNLVTYSPNGIDNVESNGILLTEKIVESSRYFSAGIQVKLGFALGKKKMVDKTPIAVQETIVENAPPLVVKEKPVAAQKPVVEAPVRLGLSKEEIEFIEFPLTFGAINEVAVTKALAERLDAIAVLLKKDSSVTLDITGYTCNLGSQLVNEKIGMQRAEAVGDYLKERGIAESRMQSYTKGESNPIVPNTSTANRQKNRRVSILIQGR